MMTLNEIHEIKILEWDVKQYIINQSIQQTR
jgi:hypothetical protein